MTTALYLIGPPGVGKTTVTDALLQPYERSAALRLNGILWGEVLDPGREVPAGVHLGSARVTFGGTDTLGMSVQRDAIEWVSGETPDAMPSWVWSHRVVAQRVIGEGQRLGNSKFLTVLAKHTDLTVAYLVADPATLDERCARRGSNQAMSWRRGAETKALRCAERLAEADVKVREIDAQQPLAAVVQAVRDASGW